MVLLKKIGNIWKRVLLNGAMVLGTCDTCCSPPICGNISTCNNFFKPQYASIEQPQCCDCPCPDRKDYPGLNCALITIRGCRPPPGTFTQPDGSYVQFGAWPPLVWDNCNGDQTEYPLIPGGFGAVGCPVYTYNSDGTLRSTAYRTYAIEDVTLEIGLQPPGFGLGIDDGGQNGGVGASEGDCAVAYFGALIFTGDGDIGDAPDGFSNLTSVISGYFIRCTGGLINGYSHPPYGAPGGEAEIVITDNACGTPCYPDGDPTASVCAASISVALDAVVGVDPESCETIVETLMATVDQTADCTWSKTEENEQGISIDIEKTGDCPGIDYGTDCVGIPDEGVTGSTVTWTLVLDYPPLGTVSAKMVGSCPSTAAIDWFISTTFSNFQGVCYPDGLTPDQIFPSGGPTTSFLGGC